MEFKLETTKGSIALNKKDISLDEIISLSEMVGVEKREWKEPPAFPKKKHIGNPQDQIVETKSRPRQHPLKGSTETEGFPIAELIGEKKEEKKMNPHHKQTFIVCPKCGVEETDTVPPYFKFKKCTECGTKIYLADALPGKPGKSDADGNYYIGKEKFIPYEERMKHKEEVEEGTPKPNFEEMTVKELKGHAAKKGIEVPSKILKADLINKLKEVK